MTNTIEEALQYSVDHANDLNWEGDCERLVHRAGAFSESFATALLAGNASGHLDVNPDTAQRGEIHYWAGVWDPIAKRYSGHVAFELGTGLLLMASSAVTQDFGRNIGTIPFYQYQALKRLPYRGHTFRHGTQKLAVSAPAGGGTVTPIPPTPKPGGQFMIYEATTDYSAAGDPVAFTKGLRFINDAEGPLRPMTNDEYGAYTHNAGTVPFAFAPWDGAHIRNLIRAVGVRQWTATDDVRGFVLTGKTIF